MSGGTSTAGLRAAVRAQAREREKRQLAVAAGVGRILARAEQRTAAVERAHGRAAAAQQDAVRALAAAAVEFGGADAASAILNPVDPGAMVEAIRGALRRVGAGEARREADRLAAERKPRGRPARPSQRQSPDGVGQGGGGASSVGMARDSVSPPAWPDRPVPTDR